jgi:hypothetical protein
MNNLRSFPYACHAEPLKAPFEDPASYPEANPAPAPTTVTSTGGGNALDLSELDAHRIHLAFPPPMPVAVFTLQNQPICTAGNLTVISAQAKGGKSAIVGAMVASVLVAPPPEEDDGSSFYEEGCDLLGFTAAPHAGRAVVLFDTEQSPYDAWTLVHRATLRAHVDELPANFRGYTLADISTERRRAFLAAEMRRAQHECGGIHSVFIDGVADLCKSPNDDVEAFALVAHLAQLAITYACPIILVLHENPSGLETGKTRGHLGSQLERKAESNLRIIKDGKGGTSLIFSERCRHACIAKDEGPRFAWSTPAGMHITVEPETKESRAETARQEEHPECQAVFVGHVGEIAYGELKQRIMTHAHVSEPTAKRRIKLWQSIGLIKQGSAAATYLRA